MLGGRIKGYAYGQTNKHTRTYDIRTERKFKFIDGKAEPHKNIEKRVDYESNIHIAFIFSLLALRTLHIGAVKAYTLLFADLSMLPRALIATKRKQYE